MSALHWVLSLEIQMTRPVALQRPTLFRIAKLETKNYLLFILVHTTNCPTRYTDSQFIEALVHYIDLFCLTKCE